MARRVAIVFCALLAAGVALWFTAQSRGRAREVQGPSATFRTEVDLGEQDINRTVEATIPIENAGNEPLALSDLRTDCGCIGVRVSSTGERCTPNSALALAPGDRVELVVAIAITGSHGARASHTISFRTNDPRTPELRVRLTFVARARYFSDPATVSLTDESRAATVGLYSTTATDAPSDLRLDVSPSARFRVVLESEPAGANVSAEAAPGSRRFAVLRVEVGALTGGEGVTGEARVFAANRSEPILVVPLVAKGSLPVELLPNVLFLPRQSANGPLYSGVVLCRGAGVESLALTDSAPAGYTVRVEGHTHDQFRWRVQVECDPATAVPEATLRFVARRRGSEVPLALRVSVAPAN